MFYKQRKMDAENQLFFRRVAQLPIVKAASVRAINVYETAKNSNRLFNATFQLAENSVKRASEIDAVKKILDSRLVALANNVAVDQLKKVEQKYPVVHKTPDQLWSVGKDYYEHSRVKNNVDKLYSAKRYGVTKINDTKEYYQNLLFYSLDTLLDYSDSAVNKYVAVHGEANGQPPQCGPINTYVGRVGCISGNFYHGLEYRTEDKYDATKQDLLKNLGDLHIAVLLIEYAKNTAAWAKQKTQATLTTAQEQAKALWHEIQRRAEPISGRSEATVLHLVQGLAVNIAALSQQLVKFSSPYLPESLEKTVVASAVYATELRDTFAKAKTLGELRDEVIAEAKQKLGIVQDGLTKGMDYLIEFPPISWLTPARNKISSVTDGVVNEKAENGFAGSGNHGNGGNL
jgi:hypothetical protein